jgi:hypothetical protein
MELVRLTTPLAHLSEVAIVVSAQAGPLVIACTDADPVMAAATLRGQLDRPVGVWLHVSSDYSPAVASRDVATLSWLIDLEHVVVSAEHDAPSHADVLEAMLTNDEVNFANGVAVIVKAFNRPAPPKPIAVWSYDGRTLNRGKITLIESSAAHFADVSLTTFA